jgi:inosine-uridine nucleoside N-ribohydrolase
MKTPIAVTLIITGALLVMTPEAAISAKSTTAAPAAILTTDCGAETDDQWALAHLLLSTNLDLQAVITTHASSIRLSSARSAEKAAEVIRHVLPARASSLPVVAGSSEPLQDAKTPRENAGVDLLLRLSKDFSKSRRLIVFAIGAGTDVASAILNDPSVSDRITVVAMGFIDWPNGGDFFNVKNDPLAWQVILNSDVPLVIGSGAAAKRGLKLTRAEAAALMRSHGPTGEYLYSQFDDWLTREPKVVAPQTWVIWDEIVVAYALGLARGREVPRPQLQPDLSFSHPETTKRITWLDEIDTEQLWRDFTRKIDSRARTSP